MAEKEIELEFLRQKETTQEEYYDYEARFVKQRREQDRINTLPRVIKPAMFAGGEFALGELRVFGRYTVAPLSCLTCGFLELGPGERSERQRMVPSIIAYIIDGKGECVQESARYEFQAGDLVMIPPYTAYHFASHPAIGFRAWLPQVRLWHGQGLLWRERLEFQEAPNGTKALRDDAGKLTGYIAPNETGGLHNELEVRPGPDPKREAVFASRRSRGAVINGKTRYDWFLRRLEDENEVERKKQRVIRGGDCAWESTRQGRLKFYISRWTEVAAGAMDLMVQEIEPRGFSGEHRHIFEELLFVESGRGYDLHEGTRHPWAAGDLICIPPMIAHRHVSEADEPVRLVSVWARQPGHEYLGGIEQIKAASGWKGGPSGA